MRRKARTPKSWRGRIPPLEQPRLQIATSVRAGRSNKAKKFHDGARTPSVSDFRLCGLVVVVVENVPSPFRKHTRLLASRIGPGVEIC